MGINLDAMNRFRSNQKGDGLFTFGEGDTVIYVAGPCREDDELNFVSVFQHRLKDSKAPIVCLDTSRNHVLTNPNVQEYLERDEKNIEGGCPVCQAIAAGHIEAKDARARSTSLWNIVVIKTRPSATAPWVPSDFEVRQIAAPWSVSEGIMDVFANEGDITDVDGAIYIRVTRKGKGLDTEYGINADSETIRKPAKLKADERRILAEALSPGGRGDLYRIVASFTKSRAPILEMLDIEDMDVEESPAPPTSTRSSGNGSAGGGPVKASVPPPAKPAKAAPSKPKRKAASGADDEPPPCFEIDCSPEDEECRDCAVKAQCSEACGVETPPDRVAAAPKKKNGAAKPVPVPVAASPEEEDDEEHEGEELELVAVSNAELDLVYTLPDGSVAVFKGVVKGKGVFELEDSSRVLLSPTEFVRVTDLVVENDPPSKATTKAPEVEQEAADDMAEMEALLAQKKSQMTNSKSKARA